MKNMQKPDKKRVNQAVLAMGNADAQLQTIVNRTQQYKNTVRQAYQNLQMKSVQSTLVNIPVEELNRDKSGIRVAALKNAGINNIAQLAGISRQRLMSINGIGEDGAARILAKTQEICKNASQLTRVKIGTNDKNTDTYAIISAVYVLMKTKQASDRASSLYSEFHDNIVRNINSAKQGKSVLKWFFTGQQKKNESIAALQFLENLIGQGFVTEVQNLTNQFQSIAAQRNQQEHWKDFEQNAASYFAWIEQITGVGEVEDVTFSGLSEELAQSIDAFPLDTSLLNIVLRNYQVFGTKYVLHQKKVLLGDEMGLGKTVQAIAAMAHLQAVGRTHFMVVCPVSVMINWTREITQHSQLKAMKIHGDTRDEEFIRWQQEGGVAVTTYETISRLEEPQQLKIDMLTVDEAHYVKNPEAIRTKALVKYAAKSEYILFMTGTPIENKVEEMIFLIQLLNPTIATKIDSLKALSQAPEFREAIAPVYLRRVRDDVLTELPDKLEKEEWCEMTAAEEAAYKEALLSENYMKIRQVSWNVDNIADSTKAKRLLEICEDAKEDGRKVIVFSFFLDTITKIQGLLGEKCYGPINGSVSAEDRQTIIDEFGKAEAGSVLICQIVAAGTGLNIQTASVVVICEPQWKPSTENQAISRVYRMGQVRNVMVHRLISDETVDERILEVLKGKTEVFDNFADESAIDTAAKSIDEKKAMSAIVKSEMEKYGLKNEVENHVGTENI